MPTAQTSHRSFLTIGRTVYTAESELECSADVEKIEYLSAVLGVGCVCLSERTPAYCGDDGAVQKCSDVIDSNGKREIKCYVKCSPGWVATDQNTCSTPNEAAQTHLGVGSCPIGSAPAACAMPVYFFVLFQRLNSADINSSDKTKQESRDEEERRAREEERQERAEARKAREEGKKAREEESKFREELRAMNPCECPTKPTVPSIKDAPAKADASAKQNTSG
ncbi:hypothetical protein B0H19DRAFT_1073773 [Mycena capillaripes]|nr:hypothetical protein B0H19DRAFT_1073773 [Mycena capillaripes]